jgi:hypothetical protein
LLHLRVEKREMQKPPPSYSKFLTGDAFEIQQPTLFHIPMNNGLDGRNVNAARPLSPSFNKAYLRYESSVGRAGCISPVAQDVEDCERRQTNGLLCGTFQFPDNSLLSYMLESTRHEGSRPSDILRSECFEYQKFRDVLHPQTSIPKES